MPLRRTIIGLALALAVIHMIAAAALAGKPAGIVISNLLQIAASLLAAVACALRSRGVDDLPKRFWQLMATAFTLWLAGQATYTIYVVVLGRPLPNLAPSDVPFIAFYLALAAALFLGPRGPRRHLDWIRTLDFAQVAIVLTTVYLYIFLFVAVSLANRVAFLDIQSPIYDFADLVVVGGFLLRAVTARSREVRRLFGTMAVALTAYAFGDVIYSYGQRGHSGGPGSWFDLAYTLPFLLAACLAMTWRPAPAETGTREAGVGRLPFLLPMLAPVLVLVLSVRIVEQNTTLAVLVITASFICYSARLGVTQYRQRQALDLLGRSEARYRELVESIAAYSVDASGKFLFVSPAVERLLGYKPEELIGRSMLELLAPEERGAGAQVLTERLAGAIGSTERRILTRDGQARWVWGSARPIFERGSVVGLSGVVMDVTDRVLAQQALRESEEKLSRVFQTSPDAITLSTLEDGHYLEVNEAFLRVTGFARDEVIGRSSFEIGLWVDPMARATMLDELNHGGRVRNLETFFRMKSGEQRLFLMSADAIELQGRRCLVAFSRDITERRLLEQQFRQAQKMEAVGRLAGGIAHDFNNLLTVISGYMQLLLAEPGVQGAPEMREVADAADRAAGLTRQLLAFSRRQVLQPRVLDLADVVRGLEKMMQRLLGEDIELQIVLAPSLSAVRADPGQIEQVVMNLAVNARDAMPQGGKLVIETRDVQVSEAFAAHEPGLAPGDYVMLAVSDTGHGMDKETQAHIFEPFFTTKEMGRGTGLGLSTVYGIVKQTGGYILVGSEPGQGATFRIYLPPVAEPVERTRTPVAPVESLRGNETVMVVEDDGSVRALASRVLRGSGYHVLEAERGVEAEAICRSHDGKIHLLLTDIVLPDGSGADLARRLRAQRPEMRILCMSGHNTRPTRESGPLPGVLLDKPFTPGLLSRRVREVLEQPVAGD
ncbi:MAG: PAS domain S-box protein [Candidatus Koribacter versatilis]|uniref:histidine kinase n=1 Tax=Candidatus Korobacter versatilis TaxID=658062 RepID=A0A932EPJ3_9BACT|nr:PAS domain S-box protein [Candidatus Koribacter versatilis]